MAATMPATKYLFFLLTLKHASYADLGHIWEMAAFWCGIHSCFVFLCYFTFRQQAYQSPSWTSSSTTGWAPSPELPPLTVGVCYVCHPLYWV